MNIIDLFVLFPVVLFAFRGFTRGLIREIFSLIGIVLAVFISFRFMDVMAVLLQPLFDTRSDMLYLMSGILLFILTLVLVHLLALLVERFFKVLKLNLLNKIAGSLFGGLKSAVVVSALLLLLAGFNIPDEQTRNSSLTYPYIIYIAPGVYNVVASVYPGAENFFTTIQNTLEENNPIQDLPLFNP